MPWVYTAWNAGPALAVHAAGPSLPGVDVCDGFVFRGGDLRRVTRFTHETSFDEEGYPVAARYQYEDEEGQTVEAAVEMEAIVPVPIEPRSGASGPTHFRRGPARFDAGGRAGRGDVEYNDPEATRLAQRETRR